MRMPAGPTGALALAGDFGRTEGLHFIWEESDDNEDEINRHGKRSCDSDDESDTGWDSDDSSASDFDTSSKNDDAGLLFVPLDSDLKPAETAPRAAAAEDGKLATGHAKSPIAEHIAEVIPNGEDLSGGNEVNPLHLSDATIYFDDNASSCCSISWASKDQSDAQGGFRDQEKSRRCRSASRSKLKRSSRSKAIRSKLSTTSMALPSKEGGDTSGAKKPSSRNGRRVKKKHSAESIARHRGKASLLACPVQLEENAKDSGRKKYVHCAARSLVHQQHVSLKKFPAHSNLDIEWVPGTRDITWVPLDVNESRHRFIAQQQDVAARVIQWAFWEFRVRHRAKQQRNTLRKSTLSRLPTSHKLL